MKKYPQFGHWTVAAGLCLASLGGCQHGGPIPANPGFRPPSAEAAAKPLSAAQMADLQVGLGRSLEKRGQMPQAMTAYQEALKQDPSRADANLRLATLFDQQGKFATAEEYYRKALALKPASPDIYCNMGYSLYLQRRLQEAEMNFRQAVALDPDHARAHNNLGLVLAHMGRKDDALAEFRKGGVTMADAHANLAFVLMLEKAWPEAQTHFESALAMDPNQPGAKKGLAKMYTMSARSDSGVQTASFQTPQVNGSQAQPRQPAVEQTVPSGPAVRNQTVEPPLPEQVNSPRHR